MGKLTVLAFVQWRVLLSFVLLLCVCVVVVVVVVVSQFVRMERNTFCAQVFSSVENYVFCSIHGDGTIHISAQFIRIEKHI